MRVGSWAQALEGSLEGSLEGTHWDGGSQPRPALHRPAVTIRTNRVALSLLGFLCALALMQPGPAFAQAKPEAPPPAKATPPAEIDVSEIPDEFLTPEGRRMKAERKAAGKPGGATGAKPAAPPNDLLDNIPDEFLTPEARKQRDERRSARGAGGQAGSGGTGSIDPGGLPNIDASDAVAKDGAALLEEAKAIIPRADDDLNQIRAHANAIMGLCNACAEAKCPVVKTCAAAGRLLQELVNAEHSLDAALGALNRAGADAAQAHNNVIAQTRITSTNLSIAQEALGVKQYFYRLATMLFDLASVADDIKNMMDKGTTLPGDNWAAKLDTFYETLKDFEGLAADTINAANAAADVKLGTDTPDAKTPMTEATASALGVKPETMSGLNDLKSNLSDAANTIDEARQALKEGKTSAKDLLGGPLRALSKIAFRDLKVLVEKQMKELEKLIGDLQANLSAEERVLAGLFEQRGRIISRRDAASDALNAVRNTRGALSACMARACGLPSLTRPAPLPDYYAPPPGMTRTQVARHFGWGRALRDLNPKVAASAIALAERFTVEDSCPGGEGETWVDPPREETDGGTATTPRNTVTTSCIPCRPIADRIARILDQIDFLQGENANLQRLVATLPELRERLRLERQREADVKKLIDGLREAVRTGQIGGRRAGFNVGGSSQQSLTLAEAKLVEVRGQVNFLEREIRRIEALEKQIARNLKEIDRLHGLRRELRRALRVCEEDKCRRGYWSELDTWINIAGNNPMNPVDPTGPTTTIFPVDPSLPVATITLKSNMIEGGAPGAFTITLSKPVASNFFIVNYSLSGTATFGADYLALSNGTPITNGTSVDVTITPTEDTLVEGTETVQITLLPGAGYTLGVPSTAIMTLTDNDSAAPVNPGTIQLSASTYSTAEGQGSVTITATRTGGTAGEVTVQYNTGPSSATAGSDYTPVSGVLNWGTGDSTPKTFTIPILDDTSVEGPESFFVTLGNPTGGATLGAPATASVTIADNDVASGPCGAQGHAWQGNTGSYFCSGNCSPVPSPQSLSINGDILTLNPHHAGGAATFQGCGGTLTSQSSSLTYFSQSNHTNTITRSGNNAFSVNVVSSGGGTCSFSCSR